jgi:hypothetical protein
MGLIGPPGSINADQQLAPRLGTSSREIPCARRNQPARVGLESRFFCGVASCPSPSVLPNRSCWAMASKWGRCARR